MRQWALAVGMSTRRSIAIGIAMSIGGAQLVGCGGGVLSSGTAGSPGGRGGAGGAVVMTGGGGATLPIDAGPDPYVVCSQPLSATPLPPELLIALDTSLMMNAIGCAPGCDTQSRWANAVRGINTAVGATQDRVNWGLARFADGPDTCSAPAAIDVPVMPGAAQSIASALAGHTTTSGDLRDPGNRPTRNAVAAATQFFLARPTSNLKYILLLTAGVPGCAPGASDANGDDTSGTVQALNQATVSGLPTYIVALGEADATTEASLLALAYAGYPGLPTPHAGYYATLTSGDLDAVLRTVASDTDRCVYQIPPPPNDLARQGSINVLLNDDSIPRDTTHTDGWDYLDSSWLTIQLYGTACDLARLDPAQRPVVRYNCLLI
jgi:hypothetical protein